MKKMTRKNKEMDDSKILLTYAAVSSVIAVLLTVYDKAAAKLRRRRIPERTLMISAALSGCAAMYLTMLLIRHKTRKPKFMVGIPVIFTIECLIAAAVFFLLRNQGVI